MTTLNEQSVRVLAHALMGNADVIQGMLVLHAVAQRVQMAAVNEVNACRCEQLQGPFRKTQQ